MKSVLSFLRELSAWQREWKTFPIIAWVKAERAYERQNFSIAERLYRQGLERNARHKAHAYIRLRLATCQIRMGLLSEAEGTYTTLLSSHPDVREAYLRLAELQLSTQRPLDATWTLHRAISQMDNAKLDNTPFEKAHLGADPELVGKFVLAALENDGPLHVLEQAILKARQVSAQLTEVHPMLEVALAAIAMREGRYEEGRARLHEIIVSGCGPREAYAIFGEMLLAERNVTEARSILRQGLSIEGQHPRTLGLLAQTYLREISAETPTLTGQNSNVTLSDFALQLSLKACQLSCWRSAREMHILAEAYRLSGDKGSALMVANRARTLVGATHDSRVLDRLINELETGTFGTLG